VGLRSPPSRVRTLDDRVGVGVNASSSAGL
jgi:hypothetical protein